MLAHILDKFDSQRTSNAIVNGLLNWMIKNLPAELKTICLVCDMLVSGEVYCAYNGAFSITVSAEIRLWN